MKVVRRSGGQAVSAVLLALGAALPATAQEPGLPPAPPRDSVTIPLDSTVRIRADSAIQARSDSIRPRPPITPTGAFVRSLIIPGWGQARLGRNVTGGLFVAFEGVAAAMVWKSYWQLEFAQARGKFVRSHRQEREDWLVLLGFNHLFAATEAYVSAHLYDFPAALKIERLPGGGTNVGVTIPLR